jgi:hypothetical protein
MGISKRDFGEGEPKIGKKVSSEYVICERPLIEKYFLNYIGYSNFFLRDFVPSESHRWPFKDLTNLKRFSLFSKHFLRGS